MIKVIEPGYKKFKRIFKTSCTNCGCLFEFEPEDLQHTKVLKVPFVPCPCCKESIKFDEDSLYYNSTKVPVEETKIAY